MKFVFDGICMGLLLGVVLPGVVLASGTPLPQAEVDCRTEAGFNDRGDSIMDPSPRAIPICEAASRVSGAGADTLAYLGRAYCWDERYQDARRVLEAAQDKGSPLAVALLGFMHAYGYDFNKDLKEAIRLYHFAAEQGQADAQTSLGWMYESGRGVEKDDAQAVVWYRKAAEQGQANAQNNLGVMYESGRGVEKDDAQAVVWYRKAAEQGQANAQNNLGVMYANGRGVEKDDAQAVVWYRKAAEQGQANAQNNLGVMYANGRGVEKDDAQAVVWYRKAAEQGQANAQTNLGVMYANGRGVEKDDAQAVVWYRKAAEQGQANAQNNLGVMYANGRGVEKDDAQAVVWYRKAAEQGQADAQTNLGVMYANGRGVEKDDAQAVVWYRKAAEQGQADAQTNLGVMYANGRGVEKDDAQAVVWYRKAAEQGQANAQNNLGVMYANGRGVEKDDAQAVVWYRKAAEQGQADAQTSLGWMYESGRGVEKDDAQAVVWYRKAAEQGQANAQNNLGVMYESGRGVEKDDAQAVVWYRKAAEQGQANAQNNLGVMYANGRGVEKDDAQAVVWYRKAAEQGQANAQTNLGVMYANGRGVEKDDAQAVVWYRKAAEQGQADAQTSLGWMYESGRGVEKDDAQAVVWYRKAAEQGNANSLLNFGNLLARGSALAPPDREAAESWWRQGNTPETRRAVLMGMPVSDALAVLDQQIQEDPEQGLLDRVAYLIAAHLPTEAIRVAEKLITSDRHRSLPEQQRGEVLSKLRKELSKAPELKFSGEVDIRTLKHLDELGVPEASLQIGMMHAKGRGVVKDDAQAVVWYRKAAERGDARAQFNLGEMYAEGRGLVRDATQAMNWYRKAAEHGAEMAECDARLQFNLGVMHAEGQGVVKNETEAVFWYRKSAELGDADAQTNLGEMYAEGRGITKDETQALLWYRKAADKGNSKAKERWARLSVNPAIFISSEMQERARVAIGQASADALPPVVAPPQTTTMTGQQALRVQTPIAIRDRVDQEVRTLNAIVPGLMADHRWKEVAKTYRQIADWHLVVDQVEAALAARLQSLNIGDIGSATFYGSPNNYFHLLESSCEWASAAEWSLRLQRQDVALLMAKFAVNRLQQARRQLDQIDDSLKECFLKVHEDNYRWLADLLMSMGRLGEAEQALTMLKHFEVEEYVRRANAPRESAQQEFAFDGRERNVLREAERLAEQARAVTTSERIKRLRSTRTLRETEQAELEAATNVLKAAQEQFRSGKEALLAELRALSQPDAGESARGAALAWSASIQKTLRNDFKGKAVALQFVVLPQRTHLLVTTAQTQQVAAVHISSADLSLKVAAFRQAIQNREVDVRPLAQELYGLLIAPVEPLFKGSGVDTLMISADDVLRYIPFAALHDGQAYLIERYALSNYSPLTRDRLVERSARASWRVVAFGASKGQPERGFEPLPNVASELRAVVREPGEHDGAMPGQRKLDEQFTRESFSDLLQADFPAVHLASHFRLRFGNQIATVLLLGDGEVLPLSDLVNDRIDFNLGSVQLLTLSACDTAVPVGRDSATGSEVESLATLVHAVGASSVLATLWPVADSATSRFMQGLYGYLANDLGITKAEALRRVQLDFIGVSGAAADSPTEMRAAIKLGVPTLHRQAVSLSHPYFWAPFALLGNWL